MEILGAAKKRIWRIVTARDISGTMQLGIPQRCALALAGCASKEEFASKRASGELNVPLLRLARVSRNVRGPSDGASQPVFVNHVLEAVEAASWAAKSAPNASYEDALTLLWVCPSHDEGMLLGNSQDLRPDPYYGMRIEYGEDGNACQRGEYVAALVACDSRSKAEACGQNGFKSHHHRRQRPRTPGRN